MRVYLHDLAIDLPNVLHGGTLKLFTPEWSPKFPLPSDSKLQIVNCGNVPRNRFGRALFEQVKLPGIIQRSKIDVWLGTCNALPLRIGCRSILIVQSLQYFTHPEAFSRARRIYLQTIVPRSIQKTNAIVVFSEASKAELVQRFGTDQAKIFVIPHAVSRVLSSELETDSGADLDVVFRVLGRSSPFIFCLSALYPYKNHLRLIEAFAQVSRQFPEYMLLIGGGDTGSWGREQLREAAKTLGVEFKVLLPGRVPQEYVPSLYRQATLMAMPSLDETFGLPVLEAMSFGCPVLTSNISSMAEIGRGAAELIDPYSVDDIAEGLRSVLSDPSRRSEMKAKGLYRASTEFTREKLVERFGEVLNWIH